jgi:hypothetical protein
MASSTIHTTVTGQQLIDAVTAIAKHLVSERDYINGNDVHALGQTSSYPYRHIIVRPENEPYVDPTRTYSNVVVSEHNWGGSTYAVGYTQDSVIEAVKEFVEKLRTELAKHVLEPQTQIFPEHIRFSFEDKQYTVPLEACNSDVIALPDGRVLVVGKWLESLPPIPTDFRVIGTLALATQV